MEPINRNKIDLICGSIELTDHMGDDKTIANAAGASLGEINRTDEETEKVITKLIRQNHTSPFEQVEFQFYVTCPIFVARQWMRHRTWSYNELSRRYTGGDVHVYFPETLYHQKGVPLSMNYYYSDMMKECVENSINVYNTLINIGVSYEQARMVLPLNIYTSFYAKVDLHNLFHFLELRRAPYAQLEIRLFATAIEKLIEPVVPISYREWCLKNNYL